MTRRNGPSGWEFPGIPTFLILLGALAVAWPWLLLHGTARIVAGIIWAAALALTAVLAVVAHRDVRA